MSLTTLRTVPDMRSASQARHEDLLHLTTRLIIEYSGALPAGSVMRCVARAHHDLLAAGVYDMGAAEEVARRRLVERAALRAG